MNEARDPIREAHAAAGRSPIDTIREALNKASLGMARTTDYTEAVAALAQVEQQLAAHDREVAGLWQLRDTEEARAGAAEQRADDLADALRAITDLPGANRGGIYEIPVNIARAALDRQEQT